MSKLKVLFLALLVVAFGGAVAFAETAPETVAGEAAPPLFAEAPASSPVDGSCADVEGETQADLPAELQGTVGSFEDSRVNAAGGCYFVSYDCKDCPNGQVKGCTTERCWEGGKWKYQTSCSSCGNFC